ncbi:MAG: TraB/GumN family protein [Candidatus Nanohaloarchaea archaeon]|nr:TraB/GumN family protein [Candidatus Nanohaloarchaea archaeon]
MQERVQVDGTEIVLVGTAHVSEESADEVNSVIKSEEPDAVAVELDQDRYESLVDQNGWEDMNVAEALEAGKGPLLLVNVLMSLYQRNIGEKLEVDAGADMLSAVRTAEEHGTPVSFIDRDIADTLRSALDSLSLWQKARLSTDILLSVFTGGELSEEDVEELKEKDALTTIVDELGAAYPGIKTAFLDERDAYMAHQLRAMDADTIVAVVGAAHVAGIREELSQPSSLAEAEAGRVTRVPVKRLLQYGVPALIVGMLAYIFVFVGIEAGTRAFTVWFLLNGVLAGAGAVASRAHPLTTAATFLAAPFTSINPLVPSGLVAAYAENRVNPPKVKDLEAIGDVASVGAFWTKSALKLLLLFLLVNVGSSIASYLGAGYLAQIIV